MSMFCQNLKLYNEEVDVDRQKMILISYLRLNISDYNAYLISCSLLFLADRASC